MKFTQNKLIAKVHQIKKIFQGWLSLFIVLGFIVTFSASWLVHHYLSKRAAIDLLRVQLHYACTKIDETQGNLKEITEASNQIALCKARIFARLLELDPDVVKSQAELEKIKNLLQVDELHVANEKGILIASVPPEKLYINYDMSSNKQSKDFIPALTDKKFELVQPPQMNGSKGNIIQYAGVARRDKKGIVQIGYCPERLAEAQKVADVNTIANEFRIGRTGYLFIKKSVDAEPLLNQGQEWIRFEPNEHGVNCAIMTIFHNGYLLTGQVPNNEVFVSRDSVLKVLILTHVLLFLTIFLLITYLLQKIVIKNVNIINAALARISQGNLDEVIHINTTREFMELSQGINTMVATLKSAIEQEKNRISNDMELGRTIQMSVLPDYPIDDEHIGLYAEMSTAREIGGDFYDYFPLENKLVLVIADVVGKGLSAALCMMKAKTLIKELLLRNEDPADAINQVNKDLCEGNKAQMFLTLFVAVVDLGKETVQCVNAGHNPQLIRRKGQPWEYLRLPHNLPLAVRAKTEYKTVELPFRPGDALFLYTDGVTEGQNPEHQLFGEQRLIDVLNESDCSPSEKLARIHKRIYQFAAGEPQSDDITMLAFEFRKKI